MFGSPVLGVLEARMTEDGCQASESDEDEKCSSNRCLPESCLRTRRAFHRERQEGGDGAYHFVNDLALTSHVTSALSCPNPNTTLRGHSFVMLEHTWSDLPGFDPFAYRRTDTFHRQKNAAARNLFIAVLMIRFNTFSVSTMVYRLKAGFETTVRN